MTLRRIGLLFGLAALAVFGSRLVFAEGVEKTQSLPMFQSEGANPIPFNVTCPTATWTVIIATDTISRSTFMESIPSNTQTICLLPITNGVAPSVAVSSQCMSATQGVQLTPSYGYTDYSRTGWACASSSGTVSGIISGNRTRDKHDYGNIGSSGLQ